MHPALRGDHHVHSTFSDDAVSTLAENVAAAHAAGLTELRLVDHVRRDTTWVPEFLAAVAGLEVPDGLVVRTGVEAKILDAAGGLDIPADLAGVDRILMADHQFPGTDGPWSPAATVERLAQGLAPDDALDLLISGLVGAMRRHPGNQLAHCFSILPKVGLSEESLGAERLAEWAGVAAATGTAVEVNEKWACPGPQALAAAHAAGVELVASTDSHVASDVGRYERVIPLLAGLDDEGAV
ncbi:PHP domain-containing protein [Protaetiibacter mangrovi]|uniref:PHP domain-containing protein n=1 Tax=Protaetiibacter mangrovi TaxID=2970926 RepID=A0ABT1ZH20_9MICO|nr:PHP domain-containing protein [Protaetiibacter mangrovi]MCS0499988.1 PHP domain-containing protein [Protaetiibacter mangrovi]TPX05079.1 histidinol-phosphatase [Schumannella luteola]